MKKYEKIKNQLLIAFSLFTILGIMIASLGIFYFRKAHHIYDVSNSFRTVGELYKAAVGNEEGFLNTDKEDVAEISDEESFYMKNYRLQMAEMHKKVNSLAASPALGELAIGKETDRLAYELTRYETLFSYAADDFQMKGFENITAEDKLQHCVRMLEIKSNEIGLTNILLLEKFEKDFLLKKEETYLFQLEKKLEELTSTIWNDKKIRQEDKTAILRLLHDYHYSFNELVHVSDELEFEKEQGVKNKLLTSKTTIEGLISVIQKKLAYQEQKLVTNIENAFIIAILNIMVIGGFIIYLYTRRKTYDDTVEVVTSDAIITEHLELA